MPYVVWKDVESAWTTGHKTLEDAYEDAREATTLTEEDRAENPEYWENRYRKPVFIFETEPGDPDSYESRHLTPVAVYVNGVRYTCRREEEQE
jgi:hypothetical protein